MYVYQEKDVRVSGVGCMCTRKKDERVSGRRMYVDVRAQGRRMNVYQGEGCT